jgi:hypothetical protein
MVHPLPADPAQQENIANRMPQVAARENRRSARRATAIQRLRSALVIGDLKLGGQAFR